MNVFGYLERSSFNGAISMEASLGGVRERTGGEGLEPGLWITPLRNSDRKENRNRWVVVERWAVKRGYFKVGGICLWTGRIW